MVKVSMSKSIIIKLLIAATICISLSSCATQPPGTIVEWADFVKVNGITYVNAEAYTEDYTKVYVPEDYVGQKIGETISKVSNVIKGDVENYDIPNGASAYLPIGTAIYSIIILSNESLYVAINANNYVAVYYNEEYILYMKADSPLINFEDYSSKPID